MNKQRILFVLLWVGALLFHYHARDRWNEGVFVLPAAIWAVLNPSSLPRLLILAAVQTLDALMNLPIKNNHWLLTTIVDITLLSSYFLYYKSAKYDWWKVFCSSTRILMIVLYSFAVLHKLNSDFFNPEYSSAALFYEAYAQRFPFLPNCSFIKEAFIPLTLFMEALLPCLLFFSRTRLLGVIIALLFHFVIAYNPMSHFWDFSSLSFPLLLLSAPEQISCAILSALTRIKKYLAALGVALFALHFFDSILAALAAWTIYGSTILVALLIELRKGGYACVRSCKSPLTLLLLVFLLFNGFSPYLGLKTESSFSMFSNLRTEGNTTNHLFIPTTLQIFDFQKDLVQIVSSNDPYLLRLKEENLQLPFFELQKYVKTHATIQVKYIRAGAYYTDKELRAASSPHVLLAQFLIFKPIPQQLLPVRGSR